jgi:hypothetical protein
MKPVRARPVAIDLEYLNKVLNWASGLHGRRMIPHNPMRGYSHPESKEPNPARPKASPEYCRAVRLAADRADNQRLLKPLLGLVTALGWRVSAVCQLLASDVDLRSYPRAPYGRIRKREETDKERVEMWVPMSRLARAAVNLLLERRPVIGDAWMFPAPRSDRAWHKDHALNLLYRSERLAGIEWPGGVRPRRLGFHAFRRRWRSDRRHLPNSLVAAAGGWKDVRTIELYDVVDEQDLYLVIASEKPGQKPKHRVARKRKAQGN